MSKSTSHCIAVGPVWAPTGAGGQAGPTPGRWTLWKPQRCVWSLGARVRQCGEVGSLSSSPAQCSTLRQAITFLRSRCSIFLLFFYPHRSYRSRVGRCAGGVRVNRFLKGSGRDGAGQGGCHSKPSSARIPPLRAGRAGRGPIARNTFPNRSLARYLAAGMPGGGGLRRASAPRPPRRGGPPMFSPRAARPRTPVLPRTVGPFPLSRCSCFARQK